MLTRFRRGSLVLLALAVLVVAIGAVVLSTQPEAATAGPPQPAAVAAPAEAQLNPDFARYQARFPLGTPDWVAAGLGYGERPAPVDLSYARGLSLPRAVDRAYPSSYDLRTLGKVTAVKDQGTLGASWTFASLGSLESCLLPGENQDFSEDNMALTSGFDNGGDPYHANGNVRMATAYLVRWSGPVNESEDAYGDGVTPCGPRCSRARAGGLLVPDEGLGHGQRHHQVCSEHVRRLLRLDELERTKRRLRLLQRDQSFLLQRRQHHLYPRTGAQRPGRRLERRLPRS
jgi:hypothetical protein